MARHLSFAERFGFFAGCDARSSPALQQAEIAGSLEGNARPRIAIIQGAGNAPSQTFVRAHANQLEGVAAVIDFPAGIGAANSGPIPSFRLVERARRKLVRWFLHREQARHFDRACESALRKNRVDVALAEFATTACRALPACRRAEVPLVVHFHGFDAYRADLVLGYQTLFDQAAAVVAVSRAMASQLVNIGCPPHKLVCNPCGVDCSEFVGADPAAAAPRFLAVGRMVEKKAPHLTIAAFALALNRCPKARLQLIGAGELLDPCRELTKALGIQHAVEFLGAQPHDVVQREMRKARGFVQHSITAADGDSEGTPVAILEAGACGLPVVATRHAGISDVVTHQETGLLVAELDVASMAAHILSLAQKPAAARTLGRNAAQRVRRYYTMDQSIDRLAQVLRVAACDADLAVVRASTEAALPRGHLPPVFSASKDPSPTRVFDESAVQSVLGALRCVFGRKRYLHQMRAVCEAAW